MVSASDYNQRRLATSVTDEDEPLHCLGPRCFTRPYPEYVPPQYYPIPLLRKGERVPGKDFRWKVSVQMREEGGKLRPRVTLQRAFSLPQMMGLAESGRWRWQGMPWALLLGAKLDFLHLGEDEPVEGRPWDAAVTATARLKGLSPVFGNLALRPSLDIFPAPKLTLKRVFKLGPLTKLSVEASMLQGDGEDSAGGCGGRPWWRPRWRLELHWHPADSVGVFRLPNEDETRRLEYARILPITRNCKLEVAGGADLAAAGAGHLATEAGPGGVVEGGRSSQSGWGTAQQLWSSFRLQRLKLTQLLGSEGRRQLPLPPVAYYRASLQIGRTGRISVVPGHWIDPGGEPGAPGEADFNLEVANAVEQQLTGRGWEVLRPDRDAPGLRWEEYLNWVSDQTYRGSPVLEIHGQGSNADYRGYVLGVIGDKGMPLAKELAATFGGMFPMQWRELAVPRRGGLLLECFNSDEVAQMAPWHRKWAVSELAKKITGCVETASHANRQPESLPSSASGSVIGNNQSFSSISNFIQKPPLPAPSLSPSSSPPPFPSSTPSSTPSTSPSPSPLPSVGPSPSSTPTPILSPVPAPSRTPVISPPSPPSTVSPSASSSVQTIPPAPPSSPRPGPAKGGSTEGKDISASSLTPPPSPPPPVN
eukprot:TRINITY_DN437_c0_g1_i1.p1 TRINITY_DN437_c0_g1~~TRINITY_DN437_c0_g1_i1.p1  ORF type:complete len:647 (+),score=116.79 TRINITY_DN437_c0_g1_i1:122-2062(+)